MESIIGVRTELKFNEAERQELRFLKGQLATLYAYMIVRLNAYEIYVFNKRFYSKELADEGGAISENYIACILSLDVLANSGVKMSRQMCRKLCKLFVKAVVFSCVSDGLVEIDAQSVLGRFFA